MCAPYFSSVISNGSSEISGSFTETSAKALANSLNFGSLPIRFQSQPRVEIIGPSLAGNQLSAGMVDESNYLSQLDEIAGSGVTQAERLLELYNGPWAGDATKVFESFAY